VLFCTLVANLQLATHYCSLLQVAKIKQTMVGDSKDGPARPVIRTFYDHTQVSMYCSYMPVYLLFKVMRLFSTLPQDCS